MTATSPSTALAARHQDPAGGGPLPRLGALAVVLLAVAGVVGTWHALVLSTRGQQLDAAALDGATYGRGTLWRLAEPVLDVVSVGFLLLVLGGAVLLALLQRRWGLALQVATLVVGANLTTQLLKHSVLERPDLGVTTGTLNTLPSGHTTVAASVSMALLLVVPRAARPAVAVLGAGYTAATGVATMVGQWHRPSDVLAAVLVVLAWTALVCALTPRSGRDPRGGSVPATLLTAVGLGVAALLAALGAWAILTGSDLPLLAGATSTGVEVRAYVGTAALACAVTAAAFALALPVRQVTAR